MKKLISFKRAAIIIQIILLAIVLFHLAVLSQIVPHDVVWGGKFNDYKSLLPFEITSLVLNLFFLLLVRFRARRPESKPGRIGMWLMFALFSLNTVGNLLAESRVETIVFTPLTLVLAILSLRLALKDN
jgi:hypothetical protein